MGNCGNGEGHRGSALGRADGQLTWAKESSEWSGERLTYHLQDLRTVWP